MKKNSMNLYIIQKYKHSYVKAVFLLALAFNTLTFYAQSSGKPNMGRSRIVDMLELPAYPNGKYTEQFVIKYRYTVSFNSKYRIPNWVAWIQDKSHYQGTKVSRFSAFDSDYEIANCPTHGEYDSQYTKGLYHRGHMCPREASMWSNDARKSVDIMSNICPQTPKINGNGGTWRIIENACKEWSYNNFKELYIVCGPIISSITTWLETSPKIGIPSQYFKAIIGVNPDGKYCGIAYVFNNDCAGNAYYTTIDNVERLTGFDLFHNLEDTIEKQVESEVDELAFINCSRDGKIRRKY